MAFPLQDWPFTEEVFKALKGFNGDKALELMVFLWLSDNFLGGL